MRKCCKATVRVLFNGRPFFKWMRISIAVLIGLFMCAMGIKEALHNEGVRLSSLDIFLVSEDDFQQTQAFDTMIRNVLDVQTDIHVYLYWFNQDDTITNMEEIA